MTEEGAAAPPPQVFVLDSQARYTHMPGGKKLVWAREGQKLLLPLLGLCMLGLIAEGILIHKLYQKMETLMPPLQQNSSNPVALKLTNVIEPKESNEIPHHPTMKTPFVNLFIHDPAAVHNNILEWSLIPTYIKDMELQNKTQLIIKQEGYYFLYSTLEVKVKGDCPILDHEVVRETSAYNEKPLTVLQSKTTCCLHTKRSRSCKGEDLRSSFLVGISHLLPEDRIYVRVKNIDIVRLEPNGNLLGAFMIST